MTLDNDPDQFLEEKIHILNKDQVDKLQSLFDESTLNAINMIKTGKARIIDDTNNKEI